MMGQSCLSPRCCSPAARPRARFCHHGWLLPLVLVVLLLVGGLPLPSPVYAASSGSFRSSAGSGSDGGDGGGGDVATAQEGSDVFRGSEGGRRTHFFTSQPVSALSAPMGPLSAGEAAVLQYSVGVYCTDTLSGLLFTGTNVIVVFSLAYDAKDANATAADEPMQSKMKQVGAFSIQGWATSCIFNSRNELYIHSVSFTSAGDAAEPNTGEPRVAWQAFYSVFSRFSGEHMRTEDVNLDPPSSQLPPPQDGISSSSDAPPLSSSASDSFSAESDSSSSAPPSHLPLGKGGAGNAAAASHARAESDPSPLPQMLRGLSWFSGRASILPFVHGTIAFVLLDGAESRFAYARVAFERVLDAALGDVVLRQPLLRELGGPLLARKRLYVLGTSSNSDARGDGKMQGQVRANRDGTEDDTGAAVAKEDARLATWSLASSWDVVGYKIPELDDIFPAVEDEDAGTTPATLALEANFSFYKHYATRMSSSLCPDCEPLAMLPVVETVSSSFARANATGDGVFILWKSPTVEATFATYMARVEPLPLPEDSWHTVDDSNTTSRDTGSSSSSSSSSKGGSEAGLLFEFLTLVPDATCVPTSAMVQDAYSGDVYIPLQCNATATNTAANGEVTEQQRVVKTMVVHIVNKNDQTLAAPMESRVQTPMWVLDEALVVLSVGSDAEQAILPTALFPQPLTRSLEVLLPMPNKSIIGIMGLPTYAVQAVSPSLVDGSGGTPLLLEGYGFVSSMRCRFPDNNYSTSVAQFSSARQITCVAPPMPALSCGTHAVELRVDLDSVSAEDQLTAAVALPPVFIHAREGVEFLQMPTPIVSEARSYDTGVTYGYTSVGRVRVTGVGFGPRSSGEDIWCKLWSPNGTQGIAYFATVDSMSSDEIICNFADFPGPLEHPTYLDVSNDGVVYSENAVSFVILGPPSGLKARLIDAAVPISAGGTRSPSDRSTETGDYVFGEELRITVRSTRVSALPMVEVAVVDSVRHPIFHYNESMPSGYVIRLVEARYDGTPTVDSDSSAHDESGSDSGSAEPTAPMEAALSGTLVVPVEANGSAYFTDLSLLCPFVGTIALTFVLERASSSSSNSSANNNEETDRVWEERAISLADADIGVILGATTFINVTVDEGPPYSLKFVRYPSLSATVYTPLLPIQPILGLSDECGNTYRSLSSSDLPGDVLAIAELADPVTGAPVSTRWLMYARGHLLYTDSIAIVGKQNRHYRLLFVAEEGLPGRNLSAPDILVEWCPPAERAVVALGTCAPCPQHGICNGTDVVIAEDGYWRFNADRRLASESANGEAVTSFLFYSCGQPYGSGACGPNGRCHEGYDGFRCTHCQPGYRRAAKTCHRCRPAPVERFVIFLVCVTLIAVFSLWVLWMAWTPNTVSPIVWALKALIHLLQVLSLSSLVNVRWPVSLSRFFDGVDAMTHVVEILVGCGLSTRGVQVFLFIMPLVVAFLVAVVARVVVASTRSDRVDPITVSALAMVSYTHRKRSEFALLRNEVTSYADLLEAQEAERRTWEAEEDWAKPAQRPQKDATAALPHADAAAGRNQHAPGPSAPPRSPAQEQQSLRDFLTAQLPRLLRKRRGLTLRTIPERELLAQFENTTGVRYTTSVAMTSAAPAEREVRTGPATKQHRAGDERHPPPASSSSSPNGEGTSRHVDAASLSAHYPVPQGGGGDGDEMSASVGLRHPAEGSTSASASFPNARPALATLVGSSSESSSGGGIPRQTTLDFVGSIERFDKGFQKAVGGMFLRLPNSREMQRWVTTSSRETRQEGPFMFRESGVASASSHTAMAAAAVGGRAAADNNENGGGKPWRQHSADNSVSSSGHVVQYEQSPVLKGLREAAVRQHRFSAASLFVNALAAVFVVFHFVFVVNALAWQRCDTVQVLDTSTATPNENGSRTAALSSQQRYARASSDLSCDSYAYRSIRDLSRAVLVVYGAVVPVALAGVSLFIQHRQGVDVLYATLPVLLFGLPPQGILLEALTLVAKYVAAIAVLLCDSPLLQLGVMSWTVGALGLVQLGCYPTDRLSSLLLPRNRHSSTPVGSGSYPGNTSRGEHEHGAAEDTGEMAPAASASGKRKGKEVNRKRKRARSAGSDSDNGTPTRLSPRQQHGGTSASPSAASLHADRGGALAQEGSPAELGESACMAKMSRAISCNPRSVLLVNAVASCVVVNVLLLFAYIQVRSDNGASQGVEKFFAAIVFILLAVPLLLLSSLCVLEPLYCVLNRRWLRAQREKRDAKRLEQLRAICGTYRQLSATMERYFELCQAAVGVARALDILAGRSYVLEERDYLDFSLPSASDGEASTGDHGDGDKEQSTGGGNDAARDADGGHARWSRGGRSPFPKSGSDKKALATKTADRDSTTARSQNRARSRGSSSADLLRHRSSVHGSESSRDKSQIGTGSDLPVQQRRRDSFVGEWLDSNRRASSSSNALSAGLRLDDGSRRPGGELAAFFAEPLDLDAPVSNANWIADPAEELARSRGKTFPPVAVEGTTATEGAEEDGKASPRHDGEALPSLRSGPREPSEACHTNDGNDSSAGSRAQARDPKGRTIRTPAFSKVPAPAHQPVFWRSSSLVLSVRNAPEEDLPPTHPQVELMELVRHMEAQELPPLPDISLEGLAQAKKPSKTLRDTPGARDASPLFVPASLTDDTRSTAPTAAAATATPTHNTSNAGEGTDTLLLLQRSPLSSMFPAFDVASEFDPLAVAPLPARAPRPPGTLGAALTHVGGTTMMEEMRAFNDALNAELFGPSPSPSAARPGAGVVPPTEATAVGGTSTTTAAAAATTTQPPKGATQRSSSSSAAAAATTCPLDAARKDALGKLMQGLDLEQVKGIDAAVARSLLAQVGLLSPASADVTAGDSGVDGAAGVGGGGGGGGGERRTVVGVDGGNGGAVSQDGQKARPLPPPLPTYRALPTEADSMTIEEPRRRARRVYGGDRPKALHGRPRTSTHSKKRKSVSKSPATTDRKRADTSATRSNKAAEKPSVTSDGKQTALTSATSKGGSGVGGGVAKPSHSDDREPDRKEHARQ